MGDLSSGEKEKSLLLGLDLWTLSSLSNSLVYSLSINLILELVCRTNVQFEVLATLTEIYWP